MNSNSDGKLKNGEKRKIVERRMGMNDELYHEWILRGLTQERRKEERRKKKSFVQKIFHTASKEETPAYQHLLRKIFHPDVRSSIIEESIQNLQEYIKSVRKIRKKEEDRPKCHLPFITISRQAGTGGHLLAQAVLREMNKNSSDDLFQKWQIIDQEICQSVMNDSHLNVPLENLMMEKFDPEFEDYLRQILVGTSPQLSVYHKIFKIIRTFCLVGKVIIVGRAGVLLTKDLSCGVHVRLVASKKTRIQHIMYQMNVSAKDAEKIINEKDANRARLVKTCFNSDIDDPLLYDAVWNTDQVPIPIIARNIIQMIQEKNYYLRTLSANH